MAHSNNEKPQEKKQAGHQTLKTRSPTRKKNSFVAAGALIIALSSLATALYTLVQSQHLQHQAKELITKNVHLTEQVQQLAQQQESMQNQANTKADTLEEMKNTLQTQFDELNKQVQTAMSQRFYQKQNWLLLKARYSLELAQINAHWNTNLASTEALLQHADQLLTQFNEPQIFAIRQAIAKDLAQIQAVPPIDSAGILSQLDAAQQSVQELNVFSTLSEPATSKVNPHPPEASSVWSLHLQDSVNVLKKLVIIRHNEDHIKPLLSPALEALVKENIRLNLQEAQWAVLNNDPQVYGLVLSQAMNLIKKNFNEEAPTTKALIEKLTTLQQIKFIQKRPEVNSALPLLNELINAKEAEIKQSPAATEEQGGKSS